METKSAGTGGDGCDFCPRAGLYFEPKTIRKHKIRTELSGHVQPITYNTAYDCDHGSEVCSGVARGGSGGSNPLH